MHSLSPSSPWTGESCLYLHCVPDPRIARDQLNGRGKEGNAAKASLIDLRKRLDDKRRDSEDEGGRAEKGQGGEGLEGATWRGLEDYEEKEEDLEAELLLLPVRYQRGERKLFSRSLAVACKICPLFDIFWDTVVYIYIYLMTFLLSQWCFLWMWIILRYIYTQLSFWHLQKGRKEENQDSKNPLNSDQMLDNKPVK